MPLQSLWPSRTRAVRTASSGPPKQVRGDINPSHRHTSRRAPGPMPGCVRNQPYQRDTVVPWWYRQTRCPKQQKPSHFHQPQICPWLSLEPGAGPCERFSSAGWGVAASPPPQQLLHPTARIPRRPRVSDRVRVPASRWGASVPVPVHVPSWTFSLCHDVVPLLLLPPSGPFRSSSGLSLLSADGSFCWGIGRLKG